MDPSSAVTVMVTVVVANTECILPVTLAHRLDQDELPSHIDVGDARVGPTLTTSC